MYFVDHKRQRMVGIGWLVIMNGPSADSARCSDCFESCTMFAAEASVLVPWVITGTGFFMSTPGQILSPRLKRYMLLPSRL